MEPTRDDLLFSSHYAQSTQMNTESDSFQLLANPNSSAGSAMEFDSVRVSNADSNEVEDFHMLEVRSEMSDSTQACRGPGVIPLPDVEPSISEEYLWSIGEEDDNDDNPISPLESQGTPWPIRSTHENHPISPLLLGYPKTPSYDGLHKFGINTTPFDLQADSFSNADPDDADAGAKLSPPNGNAQPLLLDSMLFQKE